MYRCKRIGFREIKFKNSNINTMRLFLKIVNRHIGLKIADYFTFNIEVCYHPTNLWMLKNQGEEIINKGIVKNFTYKKVLCVMYVTTVINKITFHGKVVSIATGNYGGIQNVLVSLGDENPNYEFYQDDYSFGEGETYFIELDELKTNKGFENLSPVDCFAKLIDNDNIGYDIRFDRYILNSKNILDASEYLDLIE